MRSSGPFLVHTVDARRVLSRSVDECASGRMAFYHHDALFEHLEFLVE